FTTKLSPESADSSTFLRLVSVWRVCASIPPSTISMVSGLSPICPAVKTRCSIRMACEYGPIAFGAFSVDTIFLPSDEYIQASQILGKLVKRLYFRFQVYVNRFTCDSSKNTKDEYYTELTDS